MKTPIQIISTTAAIAAALACAGCETSSQSMGTGIGAAGGAAVGAIAGNNIHGISKTEGAIAGAVVGGLMGNQMGRQQDQINSLQRGVDSAHQAANQTVVNIRNSNGSTTPVVLVRSGNQWQGPRGEFYDNLPTESQLRGVYGL